MAHIDLDALTIEELATLRDAAIDKLAQNGHGASGGT